MIKDTPCDRVTPPTACAVFANCGTAGPTVCGKRDQVGFGYTTAEFGNKCQLDLYNCIHAERQFEEATGLVNCNGLVIPE